MVKLTGLVLRRSRFGESSDVVHMLTGEMGLIRFNALGIRRPRSRFKGALEVLSLSQVVLYDSQRELWRMKEARLIRGFPGIVRQHRRFELAGRFAKILNKWVQPGVETGELLVLAVDFLSALEVCKHPASVYGLALLRLLEISGTPMALQKCPVCGRSTGTRFCLDVGLVCENSHPGLKTQDIPAHTHKTLIKLSKTNWSGVDEIGADTLAVRLIEVFTKTHLGIL